MDNHLKRVLIPGMIFFLGVLTLGVHLYHLLEEGDIYQILTGVLPPMSISIGLMVAAVWIYRSSLVDGYLLRLFGWVLGGAVALAALGGALLLYQISHGAEISDAVFMIGNWAATGGLGGTFIGYYETKLLEVQAELAEERDTLVEQQASLERQNQRLERFSHVVSHDLRNPLTVAKGYIELAKDTGDMSELDSSITALERMDSIIEDSLDMARAGQALEESEKEVVHLREIAENCWGVVETADASMEVVGPLQFEADESRLCRAFENLFRNAIEHGGGNVRVTIGPLPDESGFYVEDDGCGLPSSKDIFEPGFTTNPDGTGLGLAIVHDIVRAHGWDMAATSANGGARFEIKNVDVE